MGLLYLYLTNYYILTDARKEDLRLKVSNLQRDFWRPSVQILIV